MSWTPTRTEQIGGWTFTLVLDGPYEPHLIIDTPATKQQPRLRYELSPEDTEAWVQAFDRASSYVTAHQRKVRRYRLARQWLREAPSSSALLTHWMARIKALYPTLDREEQKDYQKAIGYVLDAPGVHDVEWRDQWKKLGEEWGA